MNHKIVGYRISNGKLIIGCKEYANDDEVCIVNAIFTDTDTNISYYTSKILYVSKVLYNTFKIDFQFENENQNRMINYRNDCLFSMGSLDTGNFTTIKFKTSLYGPSLASYDETENIEIYEIGTSYLNIQTESIGENENRQFYKKITLKSVENIDGEKEIVLLFVHNDKISGRSIVKPYSVKIFTATATGDIKSLRITLSKYLFNDNDQGLYSVYGITSTGDEINITSLCTVEVKTPITGVSTDLSTSMIITNTLSNNAAGYFKASYNDITKYEDIYFVKN